MLGNVSLTKRKVVAAILAIVGLGGCNRTEPATPTVGVILATDGPADYIGRPERDVLQALEAEYLSAPGSRLPFRLRVVNSAGDPARASTLYRQFAEDASVLAVIGPSTSGEAIAVSALSDELQLPLLALGASKNIVIDSSGGVRRWVFKFAQNDDLAAQALLTALAADKHSTVALLFSDDGFGRSGADQFQKAISAVGTVRLVHTAAFDPKLTSPAPTTNAVPANTGAVVVWGTAPAPAEIVRALKRKGHSSIYLSHGNASQEFVASLGADAEGLVIIGSRVLIDSAALDSSLPADQVISAYQRFWSDNLRGSPSHFGGHARDAFQAVVKAFPLMKQATRPALRDAIEALGTLDGVTGTFRFSTTDHSGLDSSAFAIFDIKNGRFVVRSATR